MKRMLEFLGSSLSFLGKRGFFFYGLLTSILVIWAMMRVTHWIHTN